MGIDLALGALILFGAIRGWLRGFLFPAIRWVSLIGCVYAADPVRDALRPYLAESLRSMKPELLDRMLWWASAVLCYLCFVGLAGLAVRIQRRRPYGEPEPNRLDQFGGLVLGTAKGFAFAALIVAGLDRFGREQIKGVDWAEQQASTSRSLVWNAAYQPVPRAWNSPPVQAFVSRVRLRGLAASNPNSPDDTHEVPPAATAAANPVKLPRPLELPIPERESLPRPEWGDELNSAVRPDSR
ncbi:CvpA family protein [Isosphaeraceae bacterium EP7]